MREQKSTSPQFLWVGNHWYSKSPYQAITIPEAICSKNIPIMHRKGFCNNNLLEYTQNLHGILHRKQKRKCMILHTLN